MDRSGGCHPHQKDCLLVIPLLSNNYVVADGVTPAQGQAALSAAGFSVSAPTKATTTTNSQNLAWAREALPEHQAAFDASTRAHPTGFSQQNIAQMSDAQAERLGVPREQVQAARTIAKLEQHVSAIERGDASGYQGLAALHA